jgi:hypothetical protein
MLVKKKPALLPSKPHQSNSKLSSDNKQSVRKSYQKHSRKGTKDYEPIDLQSFINTRLNASAREVINHNLLSNINSIIYGKTAFDLGYPTTFCLQLKEAIAISNATEQLNNYFILNKHRN